MTVLRLVKFSDLYFSKASAKEPGASFYSVSSLIEATMLFYLHTRFYKHSKIFDILGISEPLLDILRFSKTFQLCFLNAFVCLLFWLLLFEYLVYICLKQHFCSLCRNIFIRVAKSTECWSIFETTWFKSLCILRYLKRPVPVLV